MTLAVWGLFEVQGDGMRIVTGESLIKLYGTRELAQEAAAEHPYCTNIKELEVIT